jgi:hypothetical protein
MKKNLSKTPQWFNTTTINLHSKFWWYKMLGGVHSPPIHHKNGVSFLTDEMNQNDHFTNTFIKQKLHFLFNDIMEATINLFGFIIIKGFPKPDSTHSISTLRNFFLLFCKMLGIPLIQNNKNEYIYDVKYTPSEKNKSNVRGPQINDALPLHPDHGGLLGMYCLQSAENGGVYACALMIISSAPVATTIHILANRYNTYKYESTKIAILTLITSIFSLSFFIWLSLIKWGIR